jgi:hypothetical protein
VEKEVNPAFQSNSFEPIAIGLGFGVCPSQRDLPQACLWHLWEKGCLPVGRQAHGRIYFELGILNFGFF